MHIASCSQVVTMRHLTFIYLVVLTKLGCKSYDLYDIYIYIKGCTEVKTHHAFFTTKNQSFSKQD